MISFNALPNNLRIPHVGMEFDASLAGTSALMRKRVIVAQKLATGTLAAATPTRVTRISDGDALAGRGSMGGEMVRMALAADPWLETWLILLDDDAAGQAATGSINVVGSASASGTIYLYVNGIPVKIGVASGDSAAVIATNIANAVMTAGSRLPLIATSITATVALTCRWKGETGNDIDVRLGYFGERLPAGIAINITAMSGGTVNPDITPALAAMGEEWFSWMAMPYTDIANLNTLDAELNDRYGPMRQIGMRAFAAYKGTHAEAGTFGNARNSVHVSTMDMGFAPEAPYIWAAVIASIGSKAFDNDPARPLTTLALTGLKAPALQDRRTSIEQNLSLFDGMSTYTVASDGTVRLQRAITMYQKNDAGMNDDSYLDLCTPETLERHRFELRSAVARTYPRHKLANDNYKIPPGQAIARPKDVMGVALGVYKVEQDQYGWVEDYVGYKKEMTATRPSKTRINLLERPRLVGQLYQVGIKSQFRFGV